MDVQVTLLIDNYYGGDKIKTTVETELKDVPEGYVPNDGVDNDDWSEWEWEEIFQHTGTGNEEGDSAYFVTVASSSKPEIIPVGTEYEFGT